MGRITGDLRRSGFQAKESTISLAVVYRFIVTFQRRTIGAFNNWRLKK